MGDEPKKAKVDGTAETLFAAQGDAIPTAYADPVGVVSARPASEDEPVLTIGDDVEHYEITRLIGRGGMGEVYLARDIKLGRRVALKMVHPRFLTSEDAVERFLVEAKATARFNHPNIVAIYGVGEHRGAPYVALEYVRGETLRARLDERQVSLSEALRIGAQIASALEEAHRHGVLHCDLKPENVVISRDGRVRVLDFGLAVFLARHERLSPSSVDVDLDQQPRPSQPRGVMVGTPEYMAPEQWLGLPLTGGTDIWALGVMLFEMCTGRRPFEGRSLREAAAAVVGEAPAQSAASISDVPEDVAGLIARCLHKDHDRRPPAAELVQALGEILHPGRRKLSDEECPFRGLLPFSQQHADYFFGRDAQVTALVERARVHTILPVVGPSGVGKSSFVQAGLVPRLREEGRWTVLRLRPGAAPFRALAIRLVRTDSRISGRASGGSLPAETDSVWREAVGDKAEQLYQSPNLLALELEDLAQRGASNVLLLVDQLEELFTHGHDEELCRRFIEAVCTAADDPDDPVRVVFTVRGDFLDRVSLGPAAREALSQVTVLQRPELRELKDTLIKPLQMVGYRFDDSKLPEEMVAAVGNEPACLPLLQFAAQQLWEGRDADERLLLRSAYETMGGVEGALARHADGVLAGLPADQRPLARQLLLRLITVEGTRRLISKDQALDGLGEQAEHVLDRLSGARLITVSSALAVEVRSDRRADGSQLELAHESLIHTWTRLHRWLEESRDERGFLSEVGQAAELWAKRGRRAEELWQDDALREAIRTLDRCTTDVPEVVREFLQAGTKRARARQLRRRGLLGGAIALLALLAIVLIVQNRIAEGARERAEIQREIAERKRADSLREGARAAFGQRSMLEARAKLRLALEGVDDPSARALWWQLRRDPLLWQRDVGAGVYSAAISPDGLQVAAASQNGAVYLFDRRTGASRILRAQTDQAIGVAYSPDGSRVAVGQIDGTVRLWDPRTGQQTSRIGGEPGAVHSLDFDPTGRLLAASGQNLHIIDVAAGQRKHQLKLGPELSSVCFSPDGKLLVAADIEGGLHLVDPVEGTERRTLDTGLNGARGIRFSPDGQMLAVGAQDHRIRLFQVGSWTLLRTLSGHQGQVWSVDFSPDGKLLASASFDHTLRLWDLPAGTERSVLKAHDAEVYAVRFSPDGSWLVSAAFDNSVRVWDVEAMRHRPQDVGHSGGVYGLAFDPTGQRVASGGLDNKIRIWDVPTGAQLHVLDHPSAVLGVSYRPDGKRIAGSCANQVHVWDARTNQPLLQLMRHRGDVWDVTFSPDGKLMVTGASDSTVRVWDAETGEQLRVLRGHSAAVYQTAISPDGRQLATASRDRTVRIWDLHSGAETTRFDGFGDRAWGVAFRPDGEQLASTSLDGIVRLHDIATGKTEPLAKIEGGRPYRMAYHPEGGLLGVSLSTGAIRLWQLADRTTVDLVGHRGEVNNFCFSADGRLMASDSDDGTVRLWDSKTKRPFWRGVVLLAAPPRLLSHRGWERLHPDARGGHQAWSPDQPRAWHRALTDRTRYATASPERWLCLHTYDGPVELWDRSLDRRVSATEAKAEQVVSAPFGCFVREKQRIVRLTESGAEPLDFDAPLTAMGFDDGDLTAVVGAELRLFDASGKEQLRRPVDAGAVAVAHLGDAFALGYGEGNVELIPIDPAAKDAKPRITLAQVPSSAPVRIMPGPMDTLLVGYSNGLVGLWSRLAGKRLMHARIHGRVDHLLVDDQSLFAATDLGSALVWDLEVLHQQRCELLREVWARVPIVWDEGQAVVRKPPADHPCAP